MRHDSHDNRGMTLIEVLVALTLLSIVSVALIQSALLAINTNVINELRDEAVSVAEQRMNEIRNTPFANIDTLPAETPVTRTIRAASRDFTLARQVSKINDYCKQITLTVSWSYKRVAYQHSVSTVVRSQ